MSLTSNPVALGAALFRHGKCERGCGWGKGLGYCDRRARWLWRGQLYCGRCARQHMG